MGKKEAGGDVVGLGSPASWGKDPPVYLQWNTRETHSCIDLVPTHPWVGTTSTTPPLELRPCGAGVEGRRRPEEKVNKGSYTLLLRGAYTEQRSLKGPRSCGPRAGG